METSNNMQNPVQPLEAINAVDKQHPIAFRRENLRRIKRNLHSLQNQTKRQKHSNSDLFLKDFLNTNMLCKSHLRVT